MYMCPPKLRPDASGLNMRHIRALFWCVGTLLFSDIGCCDRAE